MFCRSAFIVQATDDFSFLRCDGEGGVVTTHLVTHATPFNSPEAAREAIEDHCSGCGVIFRVWIPEGSKTITD